MGEDDKNLCFFHIKASIEVIEDIQKTLDEGIDSKLKVKTTYTDNPKIRKALFQLYLRNDEKEIVKNLCELHKVEYKEHQPNIFKRFFIPIGNFVKKTFLIGLIIAATEIIFLLYRYLLDMALHDKYNLLIQLTNIEKIPESLTSETYLKIGFIIVGFSTLIGMIADYTLNHRRK